ncbi:protein shank-like isoform X2 [Watersipora subatra]|uniref:protein shank-like isoform X2 n=1 Tax=Watersipora subatra TaxID=2589382 RepID=UPI00355B26A1
MVAPSQQPTTRTAKGETIMSAAEVDTPSLVHDEQGNVRVNVFFPDYSVQKCFVFDPDENIWLAKKLVLEEFKEQLYDPLNYGLYLPPQKGKAGKFLDEERPLEDYKLVGPVGHLEFKYKRRVYRLSIINYRKLRQLHNKGTLKHFCEVVKANSLERVTKFVEKGLDPNYIDQESGETPLTLATKVSRCRSLILQLVSGGAHLDYRNKKSLTAVHTAALHGNAEAIKALLELGASPNYRDNKDLTPLYHLSKKRSSPALCAELLLRDYAHIGCKDETGNTELHQACKVGNYKVAEMLIFYGAELDYQSHTGATPLHISAFNNELSCLQTLLVRGADKHVLNNARHTPFDVANISGNKEAANILDKHDSLLVVPFEDSPMYNTNRRLAGANLEAMRLLSKSDPRINLSASVMNLSLAGSPLTNGSRAERSDSMMRSELGHLGLYDSFSPSRAILQRGISTRSDNSIHFPNTVPGRVFVCTVDYESSSTSHLKLSKGDLVTVLTVGEDGMWEGKVGEKEGWFPSENVAEMRRPSLGSRSKSMVEERAIERQQAYNSVFSQDMPRGEGVRTVVLARTKKGYGFVLRGAKAEQLKKLDVQFVPSEKMPALQYLDSVEKGSVSDKAGLRAGDFILEIDGVNVVHASHEQTVQVIKKAGDVLAMKVVRAVVTHENGGSHLSNGLMNGSATLPHRKIQKEEAQQGSSSAVLNRKSIPDTPNGTSKDDEKSAIEQLDAALANYDSDSRSSGSGANQTNSSPVKVTMREQKTASIRQRPSSSHFNSIQELDDMFAAPAPLPPAQPASDKAESRKPAKSRVKKFWSKGKGSGKLSDNKQLSLSQPNLAALDRDAEVKPITMYEMSLGHSVDDEGRALQADIPRTMSGDLSTLQRKSNNTGASSAVTSMLPPPPNFPAPTAPDDDKTSTASGSSNPGKGSNAGSHSAYYKPLPNPPESKRFLPRTPLPTDNTDTINSSHEASLPAGFGTFQRGKTPPPPPQRMSSHDYAIITVPGTAVRSVGENKTTTFESPKQTSTSVTPPANDAVVSSPFSEAIRKAAAERETDRSANNNTAESTNDIYAAVQKRQARLASADTNSHVTTTSSAPKAGGGVSVEDQLKMAVAKRRTVIERQDTTDSDRSSSHTPERTLAPNKSSGLTKSESTNFRELAEQKRQQFLKKKADSKDQLLPPPSAASSTPKLSDSSTEESLSELQKIMSRLSVAKADEPNNNTKKIPPPVAQKKPEKPTSPTLLQDHLSPVEEFPPPPPPHDFGSDASDVIIPPPSFEISSQFDSLTPPPPLSPPSHSSYSNKSEPVHHHDADNHSVTSSAGSDTISSVSQDGNRFSVATSGYGSDPNRTAKFSFSGKNVEVWTGEEVGEWLESIGLGEYKTVFAENCIEGETLVSMTKADIKELGVEKVGHRVKLDKEIKKILPESNS